MPLFHLYRIASYWDPTSRLKIALKHQALSCFGHTLRLLQESLNFSVIGSISVIDRLKKKPSWWSYCISTEETLPASILARTINHMFSNPLWTPIKFTVSSSITAVVLDHSRSLSTPRINYSHFLLQTSMHGPIHPSLSSFDGWHSSVRHIIQM